MLTYEHLQSLQSGFIWPAELWSPPMEVTIPTPFLDMVVGIMQGLTYHSKGE